MKLIIENTSKIVHLDNVPARVWEGKTESGTPVICFITRIAVPEGDGVTKEQHEEFRRELQECKKPTPGAQAYPARLIL